MSSEINGIESGFRLEVEALEGTLQRCTSPSADGADMLTDVISTGTRGEMDDGEEEEVAEPILDMTNNSNFNNDKLALILHPTPQAGEPVRPMSRFWGPDGLPNAAEIEELQLRRRQLMGEGTLAPSSWDHLREGIMKFQEYNCCCLLLL